MALKLRKQQRYSDVTTEYRSMDNPFKYQKLHELYPGRLMSISHHYTGEDIPPEDEAGVELTRHRDQALTAAAVAEEEALYRHLGGKTDVVYHPAVAPDQVVEDPALHTVTMIPQPDYDNDRSPSKFPYENTPKNPFLGASVSGGTENFRFMGDMSRKNTSKLPLLSVIVAIVIVLIALLVVMN